MASEQQRYPPTPHFHLRCRVFRARVDREDRTGIHGEDLLQNGFPVFVHNHFPIGIQLLHPILQVDPIPPSHRPSSGDGRNAIGSTHDGSDIDKWHVGAGLDSGP